MGHPTLSSEEIQVRNRAVFARAAEDPKLSNVALGLEFGVSRETIRHLLLTERRRIERNERLASKFDGAFTATVTPGR
jgi:hypothetical protein